MVELAGVRLATTVPADAVAEAVATWSQAHPVRHDVQTNATLIDDRWCELFASLRMPIREFAHAFGYFRDALDGRSVPRADRPLNPMPMITWYGVGMFLCRLGRANRHLES